MLGLLNPSDLVIIKVAVQYCEMEDAERIAEDSQAKRHEVGSVNDATQQQLTFLARLCRCATLFLVRTAPIKKLRTAVLSRRGEEPLSPTAGAFATKEFLKAAVDWLSDADWNGCDARQTADHS